MMCLLNVYLLCILAIYAKKTGVKTVGIHFKAIKSEIFTLEIKKILSRFILPIKCGKNDS